MAKDCNCHCQKKTQSIDKRARNKLLIACVLSVMFIVAEVIGGYLANSLAIVSDAAHLLADLVSFLINLLALHFASRRPTRKISFGWYRAEILGALIAIYLLWMITCVLCYVAIERVVEQEFDVNATIMLITATCGVVFNLLMILTLHPEKHGHTHQSNFDEIKESWSSESDLEKLTLSSSECAQKDGFAHYGGLSISDSNTSLGEEFSSENKRHSHKGNINVTASFLHVMGDLLQSIGVVIAALIIYLKPGWKLADPLCTFVFSSIVIATTLPVLRDIFIVLMEGTPKNVDFERIHNSLKTIPEVIDLHDLRIWSLSMNRTVLTVHIAVDKGTDTMVLLKQASSLIRSQFGISESNIQIEEYASDMKYCSHCNEVRE